jgi:hypothetical protein
VEPALSRGSVADFLRRRFGKPAPGSTQVSEPQCGGGVGERRSLQPRGPPPVPAPAAPLSMLHGSSDEPTPYVARGGLSSSLSIFFSSWSAALEPEVKGVYMDQLSFSDPRVFITL